MERAERDAPMSESWRADPIAFIMGYCRVRHPLRGVMPFVLWEWQRALVARFASERRIVILKSRQVGCSELVAAYALWRARTRPGEMILLLSRRQQDASDLLDRITFMLDHLTGSAAVAPTVRLRTSEDCWVARRNTRTLELAHSAGGERGDGIVTARIDSLPATRGTGRGKPASLVILDEWAHQPWQEEIWAAIAPTVSAGGQIIGLSTAHGLGNRFHQIWVDAEAGTNGFTPHFISWREHPERDDAWYADQSRAMEPWQLHQEYPSAPNEAFVQSGRPVFDPAILDRHERRMRAAERAPALDDALIGVTLWEGWQPGARYVIGADVAEGLVTGDYDAATVIRVGEAGIVQVAALRGRWPPEIFARMLADLGARYDFPLLAVERNNHGHACLVRLADLAYPHLYHHADPLILSGPEESRPGWPTNRATKPLIIDTLAAALRSDTYLPRDPVFLYEARSFNYRADGGMSAAPGLHDDTVMATAIAVHLAGQRQPIAAIKDLFGDLAQLARDRAARQRGVGHEPQTPPTTST